MRNISYDGKLELAERLQLLRLWRLPGLPWHHISRWRPQYQSAQQASGGKHAQRHKVNLATKRIKLDLDRGFTASAKQVGTWHCTCAPSDQRQLNRLYRLVGHTCSQVKCPEVRPANARRLRRRR